MQSYSTDTITQEDVNNGWEKVVEDEELDYRPFLATSGINLDTDSRNPEDFFNNLFDNKTFRVIADATNEYA